MGLQGKNISEREKAVLYYHIFGGVTDWNLLYLLADNGKENGVTNPSLVSKWKHSEKVENALNEIRQKWALITAEYQEKGKDIARAEIIEKGDNKRTKTADKKPISEIDYTNPINQTKKLNELINNATDQNEVLDALKVIISSQRADKESAKQGRQVRAYIPINCTDCPLYQDIKQKNLK